MKKQNPNKTFLVRKNINEPFGPDNWYIFNGAEFCKFTKTDEFKKCKRYFYREDYCIGGGDIIIAECPREMALKFERERAERRYSRKQQIESGITVLSLEKILDQEYSECDESDSDLLVIDPTEDVETKAIENEFNAAIHTEVGKLSTKKREIINHIFLGDKPCSEKKCADALSKSKNVVHRQKKEALRSMRKAMQDWRFD